MAEFKTYELFIHWKQGDDFNDHLQEANDNVVAGLRSWAEAFDTHAHDLRRLADKFKGSTIEAFANTHHISFLPNSEQDEKILKAAAKEKLLSVDTREDPDEE